MLLLQGCFKFGKGFLNASLECLFEVGAVTYIALGHTSGTFRGAWETAAFTTLLPGDVVLTGTPSGVGRVEPGDVMEVEVDGVGTLTNPVVAP